MVSDVLHDAINDLNKYLGVSSMYKDPEARANIERVLVEMDELRAWLDYGDKAPTLKEFLDSAPNTYMYGIVSPAPTVREWLAGIRSLNRSSVIKEGIKADVKAIRKKKAKPRKDNIIDIASMDK